jgi:hypothetical protein
MESEDTVMTGSSAADSGSRRHRNGAIEGGYVEEGQFSSDIDHDSEPCSSFFRCVLKVKDLEYMDSYWLPGIHDEIRNWKGFRHRLVITPPVVENRDKEDEVEFVVILYFVGIRNLRSWSTSPEVFFQFVILR